MKKTSKKFNFDVEDFNIALFVMGISFAAVLIFGLVPVSGIIGGISLLNGNAELDVWHVVVNSISGFFSYVLVSPFALHLVWKVWKALKDSGRKRECHWNLRLGILYVLSLATYMGLSILVFSSFEDPSKAVTTGIALLVLSVGNILLGVLAALEYFLIGRRAR